MSRPLRLVSVLALAVLATCSGRVTNQRPLGSLRIMIHDAPSDAVDEVWVTFDEIAVRAAGAGWTVVDDQPHTIDLMRLQDGVVQTLGLVRLPVGRYTEIRLSVSAAHVVVGGIEYPLDIPSGDSSGVKVKADFEVLPCGVMQVTLDWDLDTNLHGHRHDGYTLRPTIQVEEPVLDDRGCCGGQLCVGGVCNSGVCEPGGGEELVLHDATPELVRGYFGQDGVSVGFLIMQEGSEQRVTITSTSGEALIDISLQGTTHTASFFDGAVTTTTDLALVQQSFDLGALPPGEAPPFSLDGAIVTTGDVALLETLPTRPEYALLPWLSRSLGGAGVNGVDFPVSLPLHRMAMEAANELEVVLPPLPMMRLVRDESGAFGREPEPVAPIFGLCEGMEDDPCGNDCFGMCGNSCSCWWWICFDCCCHLGCAAHDWTCRNCKWYKPWNCILCGTFASFFAGGQCLPCFGVGSCDSGTNPPYEPSCKGLGEVCFADYECCGSDNGAEEGRRPYGNTIICQIGPSGDGTCTRETTYVPPVCGDDTCEEPENCETCFDDCGPCEWDCDDDGTCDGYPEDCGTCAGDCPCAPGTVCSGRQCVPGGGGSCGDGSCSGGENCSTCPSDCGGCSPGCGDGSCEAGVENCNNCPPDCPCPSGLFCSGGGACFPPLCGDGSCNGSETCDTCPADCGPCGGGVCGNGVCDGFPEDCGTCPVDCPCASGSHCVDRNCVPDGVVCGDAVCTPVLEDCGNCPGDCPCWIPGTTCMGGVCETYCGNGTCEPFIEDNCNCPGDCPPVCGNGTCDCEESCSSCPSECGFCSFCGDGSCDFPEDGCSCPFDCGFCFP